MSGAMRRGLLVGALAALSWGCAAEEKRPSAGDGEPGGRGDASAPTGGAEGDAEVAPAGGKDLWIVVLDATEGIGIGAGFGADIDAVGWTCPGARGGGWAAEIQGHPTGEAVGKPVSPGLGAPDGPCPQGVGECALTLGGGGWYAFRTTLSDLEGCTVRVVEQADSPDDTFEVYLCPVPDLTSADCATTPLIIGGDGEDKRAPCAGPACSL